MDITELAAQGGNVEVMKMLIEEFHAPIASDEPILYALMKKHYPLVDYLLSKGYQIDPSRVLNRLLVYPLKVHLVDWVVARLPEGQSKWSFLRETAITAVQCGFLKLFEYLLELSVDRTEIPLERDFMNAALESGSEIIAERIVNPKEHGNILFAAEQVPKMVFWLLSHGADIYETDSTGATCLHNLCKNRTVDHEREEVALAVIGELRKRQGGGTIIPFVDKRDNSGFTPLMHAAAKNLLAVVDALLDAGAEVNYILRYYYFFSFYVNLSFSLFRCEYMSLNSPLLSAIMDENKKMVRLLLSRGADPKLSSPESSTKFLLETAAACRQPKILKMVLQKTPDPKQVRN